MGDEWRCRMGIKVHFDVDTCWISLHFRAERARVDMVVVVVVVVM